MKPFKHPSVEVYIIYILKNKEQDTLHCVNIMAAWNI